MRSFTVAVALSLACAAGAAGCFWKVQKIRGDSAWVMARANAEAAEYVESFDGARADQELASFEEHRVLRERAQGWQRVGELFVMASVLALFVAYLAGVLGRVQPVGPDGQVIAPPGAGDPASGRIEPAVAGGP